ncbi:hypothetical protein [Microbacterium sp.]|uniref:hypothetical protein n=1 Tax=Microbacterium sp. TaxID=51671 RepID=UPI0039E2F6F9
MTIPPPLFPPHPEPPPAAEAPPLRARPDSWWRRNRLALIVIVVLAPVTAAGILWQGWNQYYGFGARPFAPIAVAEGDSAELAGATWGPVHSAEVEPEGFDVPSGARLIGVAVPVAPDGDPVSCVRPRLIEQSTGLEWESAALEIGHLPSTEEPDICALDTADPYELIVPFVVPADAEGPFWVYVWPQEAGGSFLRFDTSP